MIHYPITRAEYDAIGAINQSKLKVMERSPAHFKSALREPRKPPTDEMLLGSIVDHIVLGSEKSWVDSKYPNYRTREAQEWREENESRGFAIASVVIMDKAYQIATRVLAHPLLKKWSARRNNIGLTGEIGGVDCKGLIDFAPNDELLIVDLKTCQDASTSGFGRSIATYGYDVQAYVYNRLWQINYSEDRDVVFLCVETTGSYEISAQMLPREAMERAGRAVVRWLEQYKSGTETGIWPGYGDEVQWAEVPKWRFAGI